MLMLEITYALRNGFSIYYIKYNFNAELYIPLVTGISITTGMLGGICTPSITKILGKRKIVHLEEQLMLLFYQYFLY